MNFAARLMLALLTLSVVLFGVTVIVVSGASAHSYGGNFADDLDGDRADDQLDQGDVDDDTNESDESNDSEIRASDCTEQISDTLFLCESDYDDDRGDALVTVYAERPQRLTLTDAGGAMDGGDVQQRTETISPGISTLRMPVTEMGGSLGGSSTVAVTISHRDGLYSVVVEDESFLLDGPWDSRDAQISGLAGLLAGLSTTVGIAYQKMTSRTKKPRRLL